MKIEMFFEDHNPPHFHVRFDKKNNICLLDGSLHLGALPAEQRKLVKEWAALHAAALFDNWNLCLRGEHPNEIPGLE